MGPLKVIYLKLLLDLYLLYLQIPKDYHGGGGGLTRAASRYKRLQTEYRPGVRTIWILSYSYATSYYILYELL